MTDDTQALLILARRFAVESERYIDFVEESEILAGKRDACRSVQAALYAIKATTEMAAKLADQRAKFWRDAVKMKLPICPSPIIGNDRAETIASVAASLRNGEHYRG